MCFKQQGRSQPSLGQLLSYFFWANLFFFFFFPGAQYCLGSNNEQVSLVNSWLRALAEYLLAVLQ